MAMGDLSADVVDTLVKKGSRVSAIEVAKYIPDPVLDWICSHQEATRWTGDIVRIVVPNVGPWKLFNEFLPDFFSELATAAEHRQGQTSPRPQPQDPAAAATAVADELTKVVRALQPVYELDEPVRRAFEGWLSSSDDRKRGFFKFAEGADKDQIKNFARMSAAERDRFIVHLPKEKKLMTYLELRGAVTTDPDATRLVNEFLARLAATRGTDQTLAFWAAVRRAVEGHTIGSLDEFKRLLSFSDQEIIYLLSLTASAPSIPAGLQQVSAGITNSVQSSGLGSFADKLRKDAETWAKK